MAQVNAGALIFKTRRERNEVRRNKRKEEDKEVADKK